jgi:hypothetical protein
MIIRESLNHISLKILAYIIKGFFLTIKKSYEFFYRDLDQFIEFYIKGNKPIQPKKKEKEATEEIFTFANISLYTENTQFEKFLCETNMTQKINKTLKEINKKFSHADFSSMSEEKKKDYLKKNFIQPLTDNLPSVDYFSHSNFEQCININENFANYIQFDLKTISQDLFKNKSQEGGAEISLDPRGDIDFEKIELGDKQLLKRNPNLKMDMKIYKELANYSGDSSDPVRIFL